MRKYLEEYAPKYPNGLLFVNDPDFPKDDLNLLFLVYDLGTIIKCFVYSDTSDGTMIIIGDLTDTEKELYREIYLDAVKRIREENKMDNITRKDILSKAEECVCGQREEDYGTPEDNFENIANLWRAYLHGINTDNLTSEDVAMMMVLMKVARIKNNGGTIDSYIDIAGYAACGGEIHGK